MSRNVSTLIDLLEHAKAYDLAQPFYVGMPHHPVHPPFLFGLTKRHGDTVTPGGASSAAEAITLGGHVGTHIDALCHFSCGGLLHGGIPVKDVQSYGGGLERYAVDGITGILRRGVLLDIAKLAGVEELPADFSITVQHLEAAEAAQGVTVTPGSVCLIRTGWARFWDDPVKYIRQVRGPGPEKAGAEWLSARGVFAAGSDTIAFERVPAVDMPVHVHLLVEHGIHIIEALNMEELARDGVYEFAFVAAPLKIRGATGSPLRPLALSY